LTTNSDTDAPTYFAPKTIPETESVRTDLQKSADLKEIAGEGLLFFIIMMRPLA
jgi:hypothetical protein